MRRRHCWPGARRWWSSGAARRWPSSSRWRRSTARKARALADFGAALRAFLGEHGLDEAEFEAAVAADAPDR
jgi:hypothetical protein